MANIITLNTKIIKEKKKEIIIKKGGKLTQKWIGEEALKIIKKTNKDSERKIVSSDSIRRFERGITHTKKEKYLAEDTYLALCKVYGITDWREVGKYWDQYCEENNLQKNDIIQTHFTPKTDLKSEPYTNLPKFKTKDIFIDPNNLRKSLFPKITQILDEEDCILITGLPGVGKSRLAIEYARENINNYDGGTFFHTLSDTDFVSQFVTFTHQLINKNSPTQKLESFAFKSAADSSSRIAECLLKWPSENPTLLIIQGIENYQQLKSASGNALPAQFYCIVTDTHKVDGIHRITMKPSQRIALGIFSSFLSKDDKRLSDHTALGLICKKLSYLPLPIRFIGALLNRKQSLALHSVVKQLDQYGLDDPMLNGFGKAQEGTKAAFDIVWKNLGEFDISAQQLAILMSLFAPRAIPEPLFKASSNDAIRNPAHSLEILGDFHFLEPGGEAIPQLRQVIREFLKSHGIPIPLKQAACEAIIEACQKLPNNPGAKYDQLFNLLSPHISSVLEVCANEIPEENSSRMVKAYREFGLVMHSIKGSFEIACNYFGQAIDLSNGIADSDDTFTAELRAFRANAFVHWADKDDKNSQLYLQEAQKEIELALSHYESMHEKKQLEETDHRWLTANRTLYEARLHGLDKTSMQQLAELENLVKENISMSEQNRNVSDSEIADGLILLNHIYAWLGKDTDSIEICEKAIQRYDQIFSKNNSYSAEMYRELGMIYKNLQKTQEAKGEFRKARAILRTIGELDKAQEIDERLSELEITD